jgi:transcriptional regulatory protein RtcR
MIKKRVVFGLLDPIWDSDIEHGEIGRWRPTIAAISEPDFVVDQFEMLVQQGHELLAEEVIARIHEVSPTTLVRTHVHQYKDIWDFEEVFGYFHDLAAEYAFDVEKNDYLIHMSTGTHVMRICLFLLAETRLLPGRMLQTYPAQAYHVPKSRGGIRVVDLDLARYDLIAKRFTARRNQGTSYLKSGIATRNQAFNAMIDEIEAVAVASKHPILLTGPTGSGKSQLAQRIGELKRQRHQIEGNFVPVNCATLKGDGAMSALFGHHKGSFTGATSNRSGLLKRANKGLLFLDEIGELGLEEQAMLLRALETGCFYPVGSDEEEQSNFQLIAGTNRNLKASVANGAFREDLLARINLWSYRMPGLCERIEDIEPNLEFELERYARDNARQASFNRDARKQYVRYALSKEATWKGNFRDLVASVTRMATLAPGGRITPEIVALEIKRLEIQWHDERDESDISLNQFLSKDAIEDIDQFDRFQLTEVIRVCRHSRTIAEAGRTLFQASRSRRSTTNDSDRIRKYLSKFGLDWSAIT